MRVCVCGTWMGATWRASSDGRGFVCGSPVRATGVLAKPAGAGAGAAHVIAKPVENAKEMLRRITRFLLGQMTSWDTDRPQLRSSVSDRRARCFL